MTFFESIRTVFRKYAEFGGRATRPEFWWFALFSTLVSAALNAVSVPMYGVVYGRMMDYGTAYGSGYGSGYGSFSFAGVWGIAVLLPSLAVAVRRLRDAGRKWTELFWVLLPIAGPIILIVRFCEPSAATSAPDAAAPAAPQVTAAPAAPASPSSPAPKG